MKFNIRDTQQERILSAIYGLPKGDVKKLKAMSIIDLELGIVIFTENDKELIILVIDIENRGRYMKIYRVVVQEYKTFIHKIVMYSVNNGENIINLLPVT